MVVWLRESSLTYFKFLLHLLYEYTSSLRYVVGVRLVRFSFSSHKSKTHLTEISIVRSEQCALVWYWVYDSLKLAWPK